MNENKFMKYIKEESIPEDIQETIMDFFRDNPNPKDEDIHQLSKNIGVDPHKFESYVYKILGDILGYGRAVKKGITEQDVDADELERGIEVEMEHTNNKVVSKRIALDHLSELKDYYTRLDKMESEAGVKH